MLKYNEIPIYDSENGMSLYSDLVNSIDKKNDSQGIAIVSVVRLLVFLPESISKAIISPLAALPVMINDPDENVRLIVQARLKNGI
jgi:hypothetical protein